jgi:hypothetical protein
MLAWCDQDNRTPQYLKTDKAIKSESILMYQGQFRAVTCLLTLQPERLLAGKLTSRFGQATPA